jgi:hypothetical protein
MAKFSEPVTGYEGELLGEVVECFEIGYYSTPGKYYSATNGTVTNIDQKPSHILDFGKEPQVIEKGLYDWLQGTRAVGNITETIIPVHVAETVIVEDSGLYLKEKPYDSEIYVMKLNEAGNMVSEPYIYEYSGNYEAGKGYLALLKGKNWLEPDLDNNSNSDSWSYNIETGVITFKYPDDEPNGIEE